MKSLLYHLIRVWAFPLPSKIFWQLITRGVGERPCSPLISWKRHHLKGSPMSAMAFWEENKERYLSPLSSSPLSLYPRLTAPGLMTSVSIPSQTGHSCEGTQHKDVRESTEDWEADESLTQPLTATWLGAGSLLTRSFHLFPPLLNWCCTRITRPRAEGGRWKIAANGSRHSQRTSNWKTWNTPQEIVWRSKLPSEATDCQEL